MDRLRMSLLLFALSPLFLRAQVSTPLFMTMRDGTVLDATITLPADLIPAGGFPSIVLIHGSGGSKADMVPYAAVLANNGYASLAYSVRGQGNSGGYSTSSGETERLDLDEVIQYFRHQTNINPEKIGVAGGSQGGIHSWMAAAYRMAGVKAIIPTYATPRFAMDLVPNNCIKQALVWQLTLGAIRYGPERDAIKEFIIRDFYDSVLTFITPRNLEPLLDSIQIPVLQGLGWRDALFPANGAIAAAANLAARGVPIWSYYGTNGHLESIYLPEFLYLLTLSVEWFDRWLKDKPLGQSDLPMAFYSDDRAGWPHHATSEWPPKPVGTFRLYVSRNELTPTLPSVSETYPFALEYDTTYDGAAGWNDRYGGERFRKAFHSSPARFLSRPLLDTADVTGVPKIHLVAGSDASRFQEHARVYDVYRTDTGMVWQLMTRGTMGVRDNSTLSPFATDYPCYALSHRVPPGHMIGLEITSLDLADSNNAYILPYFTSTHSQVYTSSANSSYLDIPLVGSLKITGTDEPTAALPSGFVMHQNFPNPFNPSTTIRFSIASRLPVTLEVFTLIGQRIATLLDGTMEPGEYSVRFDGNELASGMYICSLKAGPWTETRKMLLVR